MCPVLWLSQWLSEPGSESGESKAPIVMPSGARREDGAEVDGLELKNVEESLSKVDRQELSALMAHLEGSSEELGLWKVESPDGWPDTAREVSSIEENVFSSFSVISSGSMDMTSESWKNFSKFDSQELSVLMAQLEGSHDDIDVSKVESLELWPETPRDVSNIVENAFSPSHTIPSGSINMHSESWKNFSKFLCIPTDDEGSSTVAAWNAMGELVSSSKWAV
jgi:hypothetical protein